MNIVGGIISKFKREKAKYDMTKDRARTIEVAKLKAKKELLEERNKAKQEEKQLKSDIRALKIAPVKEGYAKLQKGLKQAKANMQKSAKKESPFGFSNSQSSTFGNLQTKDPFGGSQEKKESLKPKKVVIKTYE